MPIVKKGPPLQSIVTLNDKTYQLNPKYGLEVEYCTFNQLEWRIGQLLFDSHSQRWSLVGVCGSNENYTKLFQEELLKYYDLLPFDGNEPPFYYYDLDSPESTRANGSLVFSLSKEIAQIIGIQQDKFCENYIFTLNTTAPEQFGKVTPNVYSWYCQIDDWVIVSLPNMRSAQLYYKGNDPSIKEKCVCLSLMELEIGTDARTEEKCRCIPWFTLFQIVPCSIQM